VFACGKGAHETPASPVDSRAAVQAILNGRASLPDRPEAIALAQRLASEGARDQLSNDGVERYALAAQLMEQVYRVGARPQDAREALDMYALAAVKPEFAVSCDAALRRACLVGESNNDAGQTYTELYRAELRLAETNPCRARIVNEKKRLIAFEPEPAVLAAVRNALLAAGEARGLPDTPSPSPVTSGNQVLRLERYVSAEDARVVLSLGRAAPFRVVDDVTPGGKPRTSIEIEGAFPSEIPSELLSTGLVTRIRAERTQSGSRISIELSEKAYRKAFHLIEPYRIVMDLARNLPGKGRNVSRVVLDPGHGGTDPGASSATGLQEKEVTLDIAHRVAPMLARDGIAVVLTRDDDRFVSLEERTARANGASADLFVSIHCNASEGKGRSGVETYVLDTSTNEMASRVAARENATSAAATEELSSILASMRMADQSQRSVHLGELLQRAALASVKSARPTVTDGGVHRAGFYVLVGARMPGVLFETSYISHPEEGALLGTADYRTRLADAIANAIRAYREGR
jgi:N-acetylmuramoyl-L-alanine amidase